MTDFPSLLRSRSSARQYLPEQIPGNEIREILEDARSAPSNSNTQPWVTHIVSGAPLEDLGDQLVAAFNAGNDSPDFTTDYGNGIHQHRAQQFAALHYGRQGVDRSDHDGRKRVLLDNLRFYGAPHAALLFMPMIGDGVRAASDVGMYAQNFLLSLTSRGYSGIPQTMIGSYATTVRSALGIDPELKMLFAISFGLPDIDSPLRSPNTPRVALEDTVVLHGTEDVFASA